MCGIAGIVDPDRRAVGADIRESASTMAGLLAHRGPDGSGSGFLDGCAVSVRRLALVGLASGRQPISNEDGTVMLACNGEVFNHRQLHQVLVGKGHVFTTDTDIEVIVHLYEERGMALLDDIEGQFAFVLHDSRSSTTYLVRDHFGICPLYHARAGHRVVFASEIAAILAYPGMCKALDIGGLRQILTLPGLVSPRTMFEGVASVRPGHYMRIGRDGGIESVRYWDLDFPAQDDERLDLSMEEAADALTAVLVQATTRRLDADVPVGAYISGGIDSALVAALGVAASGRKLPATFSAGYEESRYDESRFAGLVAAQVSEQHHRVVLTLDDVASGLPEAVRRAGTPLRESYNVASLLLSRRVRDTGMKAVIGGEGADELFAGYVGYRFDADHGRRARGEVTIDATEYRARIRAFGESALRYEHDLTTLRAWALGILAPDVGHALADDTTDLPLVDPAMVLRRHRLDQRTYLDVKLRLADHLLGDHGDRMAMANAVELRYPFLSRGVAELARRLPPEIKLAGLREKAVVRAAARGFLPDRIVNREKFAWAAPGSADMLSGEINLSNTDMVRYLTSPAKLTEDGIFDPAAVARLTDRQRHASFYDPNGLPDLLMVVLTTGLFTDSFGIRLS
jgi:asparagine synthase (glutamine-hydrolysing)